MAISHLTSTIRAVDWWILGEDKFATLKALVWCFLVGFKVNVSHCGFTSAGRWTGTL